MNKVTRWSRDSMVGRAMGAAWAVLLIQLPFAAWDGAQAPWLNLSRMLVIVAFAATYVAGWFLLPEESFTFGKFNKASAIFLGTVSLIAVVAIPLLGPLSANFAPFVLAVVLWLSPLLVGVPLGLVLVIAVIIAGQHDLATPDVQIATAVVLISCTVGRLAKDEGVRGEELRKQEAMLAERERVARDVHDVLGHSLTAISVKSDLARRLVISSPDAAAAQMAEVHELSRVALAEIRETVAGLRVARLDDELAAAESSLAAAEIAVQVEGEVRDVDPRHRVVAAWALRELVTNVIRHSGAQHCTISLRSDGIEVSDDGVGLEGLVEGNGLRGVRERVAGNGGRIAVGQTGVAVSMGTP